MHEAGFIDLKRRFVRVPEDQAEQERLRELEILAYVSGSSNDMGWDSVLRNPRVVVLGEPGSGKTEEFRHQAGTLLSSGVTAFLVDMPDLIDHRLTVVLDRKNKLRHFRDWESSNDTAWFFLDAVDESKLARTGDFCRALENFARDIDTQIRSRAHVLLSSRVSTWRPREDLALFDSSLALDSRSNAESISSPASGSPFDSIGAVETHQPNVGFGTGGKQFRASVVAIAPLDLNQIKVFVNEHGENGEDFCEDLVAHFLEPLTRRPLDVKKYLRYWVDESGFGGHMEMLEYSVRHELKESGDNRQRDLLTPEKARQGANTLAATAILCRRRDFSVPGASSDVLQPRAALSDSWTDNEAAILLDRAIFDSPLFGRIRFHHRETEEYLTACWLDRLVTNNLPTRSLKRVLFLELPAQQLVLRPAMASVTAWFACLDSDAAKQVRKWIRDAEPELFFRTGDPKQLPLDYRQSLLDGIIESYSGREFTRIEIDRPALTRFAHSDLSGYLAKKCGDRTIPQDLRSKFLYLAEFGRISGLSETALTIILDDDEPDHLKVNACAYLVAINDVDILRRLAEAVADIAVRSESFAASLFTTLSPAFVSDTDAKRLIKQLDGIEEFATNFQFPVTRHCTEKCTPDEVIRFIGVFNELLTIGPPWYREGKDQYRVGSRFAGLGDVLLEVLPSALKKTAPTEEQISELAQAVWLIVYLSQFGKINRQDSADLTTLLSTHECVRRRYLSYAIEMTQQASGNLDRIRWSFFSLTNPRILQYKDTTWILEEAETAEDIVARCLLQIAEDLWSASGHPRDIRRRARILIRGKTFDVNERVPQFPGWFVRQWYHWRSRYLQTLGDRYWWSRRRRAFKVRRDWWRNQWALFRLRNSIRRGEHKQALWFLLQELREKGSSSLTRTGWDELRKERGCLIEAAAREGAIAYWPRFTPTLTHERAAGDRTIDVGVIIGLTGIQEAVATERLNLSAISDDETRQLTRYALNEINGLPEWFERLVRARPGPVTEVVRSAIDNEWQLSAEQELVHDVVAALLYDRTGAYAAFVAPVLQKLKAAEPKNPTVLSQALRLVLRDQVSSADTLCKLAEMRVGQHRPDTAQHVQWMRTWLQFDASSALDPLEQVLNGASDPQGYLVRLATALSSVGRFVEPGAGKPSYCEPGHVHRLIVLFFRHLPPASDPKHPPGQAHTVTELDEAVRFRDGLLAQLGESDGYDAGAVLEKLLKESTLERRQDWIRHLLLQRRRRMADAEPWTERQVRVFQEQNEVAPRNPRELFELTCDRVLDIKDWVETGEDSPRNDLHSESLERDVRVWVARKLREKSYGLYAVPEEQELASGKRQDIRIVAPEVPGPVVIEVKQIEGLSYADLQERLDNQLIGDYLAADNARFGIYLISYTGHSGRGSGGDDPTTGRRLTLSEIVQNLKQLADAIVESKSGVEQVKVISIDFVGNAT